MVPLVKYKKVYYILSGTLIILSIAALIVWGLRFGIDFKGGSLLIGEFAKSAPANQEIANAAQKLDLGEIIIQLTGEKSVMLRFKEVDEQTHQNVITALNELARVNDSENDFVQKSFESVGPSIGKELRTKALTATAIVLALIIGYVALAFRKVSYPLAS